MNTPEKLLNWCLYTALVFSTTFVAHSQDQRAMNLEDIMNFHHLYSPAISYNGKWIAYAASPDRGDGYGILVSSDNKTKYKVERGENPRFSYRGNWVLFTLKPSLSETEDSSTSEKPTDSAVLIKTSDGSQNTFNNIKSASFSTLGQYVFIHKHHPEDSTKENENSIEPGTPLVIMDLNGQQQVSLPFVDNWTVDSLSSVLVFSVKDSLENNAKNGLYYLKLKNLTSEPEIIDTTGNANFDIFTWFEKDSRLAYLRSDEMEKDTAETSVVYSWQLNQSAPDTLLIQAHAPEGYFLPFDNKLIWSNDGQRLFFGFRPERYAAIPNEKEAYDSVIDSLAQQADIDIWHGEDPHIKPHEKSTWQQTSSQNLVSVYHINQKKVVQLADEEIPDVQPPKNGSFAVAWTSLPYSKKITWEGRFRDLYIIDLNTGNRYLVATGLRDLFSLSPSGDYLIYFDKNHWHSYDIATTKTINLTALIDIPFYDETNDRPSPPSSYRLAGWLDDGESILIYDRYDIWHTNLRTGNMQNMTGGTGREDQIVFRIIKMDEEPLFKSRKKLFIEGFNSNTMVRALYSAIPEKPGVNLIRDEEKKLRFRLLSGNKKTIVYTRETYNEFPDLWLTDISFSDPVRVSWLGEQIKGFNRGTSELVSYRSSDGVPLDGILIKPGDYDPAKKYPVLVYYYEKFSQRLHDFNQTVINHRPSFGYYSSNGYVVFLPDIHFKEGRPGMSAVNSLVPAVKKLIKEGIADPDAIGLHGHSWSGYQTAYVITQTDIFKAAVAGAPVANMTSAYGGIRWGSGLARQFQYETGQSRLGSSIFEKRYLYIENSPLFYAHEINTPLLIMHGDIDEAVPWEQSIELYLAMRRAGKDIIFLQYRDEPHHLRKYPNKVDYTKRMKEYFDYHLKGYEPADWIIEGSPYTGN